LNAHCHGYSICVTVPDVVPGTYDDGMCFDIREPTVSVNENGFQDEGAKEAVTYL
jgi:hypothetical protein